MIGMVLEGLCEAVFGFLFELLCHGLGELLAGLPNRRDGRKRAEREEVRAVAGSSGLDGRKLV